jgi:hypothetical protein
MLVRRDQAGALAIGQLSHSWVSGQLARAWGNETFPLPGPAEELALGAEQHDLGWAEFDLRPGLSAESGLPRSFLELRVEEQLAIWRGAPARLQSASLHAALVVSLHGRSLSELRLKHVEATDSEDAERLRAHIVEEGERQASLRGLLGLDEDETSTIQRLMRAWDGLSLALCNGWDSFTARNVPATSGPVELELRARDDVFVLEPWPFGRERVEVRCEARRLAGRYAGEAEMQRALEAAAPVTLRFALVPAA